ncbi:MAG: 16S rRNA (uracil(1498)-N(3))-methyltransferase [Alphaproteobacteria bacterium]|nr:16S rRNA (uracil(1498)-N(3))-methyltransferase [Alphaproteobacteria bacterium]
MNSTPSPYRSLSRLYTESSLGEDVTAELGPAAAHKMRAVLRAKTGDVVTLFNGRDGEWWAELTALGKASARALCLERIRPQQSEPGPWLAFAPLKKDRLDMVVEKAVELGAECLLPVITRRTENRRLKMERLAQQVVDAAEQCERLTLPRLLAPVLLERLAGAWPADRALLVAAERREAAPLAEAIRATAGPLGFLIGPEGGFEDGELDAVLKLPKSSAVNLGALILRAETAAITVLAVANALPPHRNASDEKA